MRTRPAPWPPLPPRREVRHGLAAALAAWQQTPPTAHAPDAPGPPGPAHEATRATLEAYAATLLPHDVGDAAPEERAADAVALLRAPESPAGPYLPAVAALLDARATAYAARTGASPQVRAPRQAGADEPPFAALAPERRSALCADLLAPGALDETEQQLLTLLSLLVHTADQHAGRRAAPAAAGR